MFDLPDPVLRDYNLFGYVLLVLCLSGSSCSKNVCSGVALIPCSAPPGRILLGGRLSPPRP